MSASQPVDAALGSGRAGRRRIDDYVAFCEGVRALVRRRPAPVQARPDGAAHPLLRERRGDEDLGALPRARCSGDAARARRVPRPRDDQRLPAVAQPRAVDARCSATSCPSSPRGGRAARLERRLLLRRRGLHAGRASAAEAAPGARVEILGTDIDRRMVARARAGAASAPRTPRAAPKAALERWFEPTATAGGRPPSCARMRAPSRSATCCACASRAAPTTSSCAATPSSTSPRRCATSCTRASPSALRPGGVPRGRRHRARRRRRARSASSHRSPSSTERPERWTLSDYLPMFLAECREHLQELNLAVVRIEEQPDDRETVDEIFRIAHSLKGMSATMGFAGMAALTHEMEDVFELLRQRTRRPRPRRRRRAARVPRRASERRRRDRGRRRRAASTPRR